MNHRTAASGGGGTRMNRRCGSQFMMNMWMIMLLMIVTMVQGNHHYHSAISRATRQWSWHHHRTNTPPPLLLDDMTRTDRIVIPATTTTSMMFLTGGRLGRGGGASNKNMGGVSEPTTTRSPSSSSSTAADVLVTTARLLFQTTRIILTTTVALVGPPLVTTLTTMIQFYRQCLAWDDAILAQIGLLYAFCGGYYPTLFAAIQAAQHTSSGIPTLVTALHTLYDEATSAIRACEQQQHLTDSSIPSPPWKSDTGSRRTPQVVRDWFLAMTRTVLATIDPVRINDAVAAIGTTWMSIAVVLEREFARTIALSVALAEAIRPVASVLLNLPLRYCLLSPDYDQWRPVLIGWLCKALAMSVAWRIQRVLTAYTSAICGGLVCSRALGRILQKQFRQRRDRRGGGNRRGGRARSLSSVSPTLQPQRNIGTEAAAAAADPTTNTNHVIEFFGYVIAVCGLYSQIGHGFSFQVPFPLNLVTWPLDWAERWIQWQITKKSETT